MQRCPYLHEMKERLLTQPGPDHLLLEPIDAEVMEVHGTGVPTVVKVIILLTIILLWSTILLFILSSN